MEADYPTTTIRYDARLSSKDILCTEYTIECMVCGVRIDLSIIDDGLPRATKVLRKVFPRRTLERRSFALDSTQSNQ